MPRKKPVALTKAELRIMQILWEKRHATVTEVVAALPPPPLAYTTVLTMLRILERKNIVTRKADGRAHVYRPCVEQDDAATSAIGNVLHSFFSDNKTALALRLMAEKRPSQEELASIKALIAQYEQDRK